LAEHVPGARYLELDSDLHVPVFDPRMADELATAMEEFVTGTVRHTAGRRFAAILFANIVNSTAHQRARGDRAWRDQVASWEGAMHRVVEQFSGRVVKFQGDGLMAVFGSAGEALRAARAALSAMTDLGLQGRAGVHAGEAHEAGGDLFGTCVNIAARVCDSAAADEVLTTAVVEGLVEGSGLNFDERGEADLKGIGKRRLLRLDAG
jgi:class 3 adenylate cyclase